MAKLPPIKRFVLEDYSGITAIAAFAQKFFYPLNLFLNSVYSAINNGLTLNNNTIGLVTSQSSITADASGVATTTVNWPYPQTPPVGVSIMSATISSNPAILPLLSWSYNAGVVTITMQFVKTVAGAVVISASQTYAVTFWISGG